jgi:hypothetical protein
METHLVYVLEGGGLIQLDPLAFSWLVDSAVGMATVPLRVHCLASQSPPSPLRIRGAPSLPTGEPKRPRHGLLYILKRRLVDQGSLR